MESKEDSKLGDENHDWLFDYLLTVIKSAAWDSEVLGFIDEHCMVFDSEDENKFIYTDIHNQFCERVDNLLTRYLDELGVTAEGFAAACKASRNSRDVNQQVFDTLIAMDDFQSFKKLMVKRNMELEFEAVKELQQAAIPITAPETEEEAEIHYQQALKASAELTEEEVLKRKAESLSSEFLTAKPVKSEVHEKEYVEHMKRAMDANLMEMELMQRQEEMEQIELEKAIAMSIAAEQERLRRQQLEESDGEVEFYDDDDDDDEEEEEEEDGEQEEEQIDWDISAPAKEESKGDERPQSSEAGSVKGSKDDDDEVPPMNPSPRTEQRSEAKGDESTEEMPSTRITMEEAIHESVPSQAMREEGPTTPEKTARSPQPAAADSEAALTNHQTEPSTPAHSHVHEESKAAAGPVTPTIVATESQPAAAVVVESKLTSPEPSTEPSKSADKKRRKKKKKKQQQQQQAAVCSNELAPIQPAGGGAALTGRLPSLADLQEQMARRKAEAEAAFRRNQELLKEQREMEQAAGVEQEEAQRRAAHLREQRDKLLAKKRAEREAKLKTYEEERQKELKQLQEQIPESATMTAQELDNQSKSEAEIQAEKRRNMMRIALARRMKQDLLENEEERMAELQAKQYSELDRQLRLVEELRDENRRKEAELHSAIRMQQERRFQNLKRSVRENEKA